LIALLGAASVTPETPAAAQKMKAEDVIAKHLEAIGTAELRAPSRSRVAGGAVEFNVRSGRVRRSAGKSLIVSQDEKVLVNAVFETSDYPLERMGYDGKKVSVRQLVPGLRSPLGEFILSNEVIFKEGLIGGTLSAAWPLLNLAERKSKLEYNGTEKIEGRPAHKLRYSARKGSDLKITLYFDAETFHHVRTKYERVIAATMGDRPIESAGRIDTRYQITEDFSDFKDEKGLILPHGYTLQYLNTSQNNPLTMDWKFSLTQFDFEQAIDAKEFDAEK
jgi:hypothetical protein